MFNRSAVKSILLLTHRGRRTNDAQQTIFNDHLKFLQGSLTRDYFIRFSV